MLLFSELDLENYSIFLGLFVFQIYKIDFEYFLMGSAGERCIYAESINQVEISGEIPTWPLVCS